MRDVTRAVGINNAENFRSNAPTIADAIKHAAEDIRGQGAAGYTFDWVNLMGVESQGRQHDLSAEIYEHAHYNTLMSVSADDQCEIRAAGGKGAGNFLLTPSKPEFRMGDTHFAVALRARLRLEHPACEDLTSGATTQCQHRAKTGVLCGSQMDEKSRHAERCIKGGAILAGHNAVRDWLDKYLRENSGHSTATEQFVTRWDRMKTVRQADGTTSQELERARLDNSFIDNKGIRTHVDCVVTCATTTNANEQCIRAQVDGRAANEAEIQKGRRYKRSDNPHEGLVAFAIESRGRVGEQAMGLIKAMAPTDPTLRSLVIQEAYQGLSVVIQSRLAEILLSAEQPLAPR